jgi:hypothetical protein
MADDEKRLPARLDKTHEGVEAADLERLVRSQPLEPGHYWRATRRDKEHSIEKGLVLLLQRVLSADGKPHSVELRHHPLAEYEGHYRLMLKEFLEGFEPESRGAEIRQEEMRSLQAQIEARQRELLQFQADPAMTLQLLRNAPALPREAKSKRGQKSEASPPEQFDFQAGLPDLAITPATGIVALRDKVDPERFKRQLSNQAIIAQTRADWIQKKTTEITETIGRLAPFYKELSAVALAQAEDALSSYGKLRRGLESLELYLLKGVEIQEIRQGAEANEDEPLVMFQSVLNMDEESLINLYGGGVDFRGYQEFVKLLGKEEGLLQRILPTSRSIVAMRYSITPREYAQDAFVNARMNAENLKTFVLIRNGERVHAVHCGIDKLSRLFPTAEDHEAPFKKNRWMGVESAHITVEDIEFPEAKERYDQLVFHYRRILILLAGLIDGRREVVGNLPGLEEKSGLEVLKLDMQQTCFRFASDGENALANGMPGFWEWLKEKNRLKQSGSRILAYWKNLLTADTAPGAVRRDYGRGGSFDTVRYEPDNRSDIVIAYREGESIAVKISVSGEVADWRREDRMRRFDAAVDLTVFDRKQGSDEVGYLCLDGVSLEDVEHYIHRRHDRYRYFEYVPLLYEARKQLTADQEREAKLRAFLRNAVMEGGVVTDARNAEPLIADVIRSWRAAHRGAVVPGADDPLLEREVRSMLQQLWVLAGAGRDRRKAAEEICDTEGREPLRLCLTGRSRLVLYATPTAGEKEDLLGEHPWAQRLVLEELKTKVTVLDRGWTYLPEHNAGESLLHRWPSEGAWLKKEDAHRYSFDDVRSLRGLGARAAELAEKWLGPKDDRTLEALLVAVKSDCDKRSTRTVERGRILLPLAVIAMEHKLHDKRVKREFSVAGVEVDVLEGLWAGASLSQRERIAKFVGALYAKPKSHVEALQGLRFAGFYGTANLRHALAARELEESAFKRGSEKRTLGSFERDLTRTMKEEAGRDRTSQSMVLIRFDEAANEIYSLLAGEVSHAPREKKSAKP